MKNLDEIFDSKCQTAFPYIIAEVGVNHEGCIETAKRLIDEAKEGGADAVKFQTYRANTLAAKDSPAYWDTTKESTTSQFELFSKHDKFWKTEMETLKYHCDSREIQFMSTPFDIESANFLNDLMSIYKISSSDITNKPFIQYISKFGKPIILSTGASHLHEIQEAASWIEEHGNPLALLHCVLNYPTPDENAELAKIRSLQAHFPRYSIGYSDHTLPNDMKILEIATILGSKIIEKHFTHDKSLPGNDHYHAMDMADLKKFKKKLLYLAEVLGSPVLKANDGESIARRNARRSLVAGRSLTQGTVIKETDLTWKRPATGISPKDIDSVIGRSALTDISEDTILQWNMLSY